MALPSTARIEKITESMYYMPNFISPEEEKYILQKVNDSRWVQLSKRRLQPHPSALLSNNTLLAAPLPDWLHDPVVSRFSELKIFSESKHGKPNHVLVNEYQPGQGIMRHEDGAAYHPLVATVSLGAPIVLDVFNKREDGQAAEKPSWRVLQEERSLLVTRDEAYTNTLHGIKDLFTDEGLTEENIANWSLLGDNSQFGNGRCERTTRVSLTYRDVLKVSKAFAFRQTVF